MSQGYETALPASTGILLTMLFNTSSSMGRLTLNVLLSFAQFEREVTAERIRDKIAASKKKGLWMGGNLPLGYDRDPDTKARTLVVNQGEAATVRRLFTLYAEQGCLRRVAERAAAEALRSKRRIRASAKVSGGGPLSRGQIYYLLRNPVYLGKIRHKEKVWPGQHDAIIDQDLWNRVQERMQVAANRSRSQGKPGALPRSTDPGAWLTGKLRDETGDRLTPTHTTRKGRRLRYYVSNRLIAGGADPAAWRLPGPALETSIRNIIATHLTEAAGSHRILDTPDAVSADTMTRAASDLIARLNRDTGVLCADLLSSATLRRGEIDLELDVGALVRALGVPEKNLCPALAHISAPFDLRRRGVEARIIAGDIAPDPDPHLRAMLIRAHGWARALRSGTQLSDIARREGVPGSFIRTRARLAFLSPGLQAAILDGSQPPELTLKRLVSVSHPLAWADQERLFGF